MAEKLSTATHQPPETTKASAGDKVSIIIPCAKITDYALTSIRYCLRLDYPDFEIIVLPDEAPDTDIEGATIIPTGKAGPAEKRDTAAACATGEYLAFIDDDAYPAEGWLKEATVYFQDEEVGAVGGPGVTPPDDSPLQKASGLVLSSPLGSGSQRLRTIPRKKQEIDDCPSCNFIVRKSVFEQLGGFDTGFWPGEDTKFCLELTKKLNKKIIYDPAVLVYHHRRKLFRPHMRQIWNYAVHRGYFVKKLPETSLRVTYFMPSLFVAGLVAGAALSFLFTPLQWVYLAALALYLVAVLAASFSRNNLVLAPLVFSGIITTHITYGVGFLKGLLTRDMPR